MSDVVAKLRDRRTRVVEEARRLAEIAAEANRNFSGEEEAQWQTLNSEIDALDKRIGAMVEGETRAKKTEDAMRDLEGKPRVDGRSDRDDQRSGGDRDGGAGDAGMSDYEVQLRGMLTGASGAPRAIDVKPKGKVDFRTLSKLTAPAGGNTIPTTFYDQLIQHMIETSSVLQAGVRVLNTTGGETIQIPKTTTHSTAGLVAEAAAIGVSDPAFAQASLSAYKYGVMVQVSRELVDDSAVDLMGYLAEETGRALGNAFGAHLVTGTGSSQPRGITLDSTLGVTATGGGSPTGDNLIDLYYSLIAPYRNAPSAAWMMKDTSVGALRKVKDTTGQYIWQQGLVAGAPDMILGKPVLTDPFMPAVGVGAKSVLFGDFSRYFVRLAGGIRFERSDEYAFNTDLVTFRALLRGDGALIDTSGAVKHILGAA